jgi:restriction system protein
MEHRRKNQEMARGFLAFSWWASAVAGGIVFILMYWVVPSLLAGNQLFVGLSRTFRSFAWLPLLVFGSLALVAFAKEIIIGESNRKSRERRKTRKSWRDTSVNISRLKLTHGWGVTRQGTFPVAKPKDVFDKWTIDALRVLEWKRFEFLAAEYYEAAGFQSETIRCGADGGFDVKLFKTDPAKPLAVLHCKSGYVYSVGVKELRELLSLMSKEKVARGIFITTGAFTRDVLNFVGDHPIQLLDGEGFLRKIQALPREDQDRLLKKIFEGDYKTPTCPSCAIKMKRREGDAAPVWGCVNYPTCRNAFAITR